MLEKAPETFGALNIKLHIQYELNYALVKMLGNTRKIYIKTQQQLFVCEHSL